ncbi:hypothetical protein KFL_003900030 [Klebsormidium nitens]|uniref:Biogenesis of lysosome-related organelles complex 1 subunit 1 n=1 Tax=Klebsormidium nitens TaxID=105231 RepID=A0A1Y1IAH2_KLENI|nr:hypothetical protein KFL_003900030 [Klebsormidium nitens]|eukprot:GAQ87964.1 hypothetical protein KFL_003900030 [Klebsormidium nitens]
MASIFDEILTEHAKKQLTLKESTARQKQVALASVSELMDLLVDSVNKNVQEIFVNQKRIEVETRALVNSVGQYTKQTQQWVRTLSSFDDALKEIGDFENWTKTISWEVETMAEALQHIAHPPEG